MSVSSNFVIDFFFGDTLKNEIVNGKQFAYELCEISDESFVY